MWLQVVHILSSTQSLNTKFFALQVCEYNLDKCWFSVLSFFTTCLLLALFFSVVVWRYWWKVLVLSSLIQVLEGVIKYRWNALPVEQRDGMKNYISEVIVKVLKSLLSHNYFAVNFLCLFFYWYYYFFPHVIGCTSFPAMRSLSGVRGFTLISWTLY